MLIIQSFNILYFHYWTLYRLHVSTLRRPIILYHFDHVHSFGKSIGDGLGAPGHTAFLPKGSRPFSSHLFPCPSSFWLTKLVRSSTISSSLSLDSLTTVSVGYSAGYRGGNWAEYSASGVMIMNEIVEALREEVWLVGESGVWAGVSSPGDVHCG